VADDILRQAVQGISDIITIPGIINRDFADVKAIMAGMGYAVMGTASAKGEHRATAVAQRAIASPLLEAGAIDGARGILINVTGSSSLKLAEVNEASMIIQTAAHEDANIIFGAVLDEKMKDEVKITVIATGFKSEHHVQRHERAVSAAAAAISQARTASSYVPRSEHAEPQPHPSDSHSEAHPASDAPKPAPSSPPIASRPTPTPVPQRENTSIADVKSNVKTSYEDDDLDVPAFIRKRNESN
jgi:cell division protein FtsZ